MKMVYDRTNRPISHYLILERLGGGSMGEVYKAEDLKLGRLVVIKFPLPELIADQQAKQWLLKEARAAAALSHPNIITIYEFGDEGDQLYIAMEYVEGEPLSRGIEQGPLTINNAVDIAIQTLEALQAAHLQGVIHCDVKSSNLMLTGDCSIKVLDFGLARLASEQVDRAKGNNSASPDNHDVAGTLAYMSPEQARGVPLDARTDLYVVALSDVWVLTFANGLGGTPQWLSLPSAPIGRVGHVAAYDAVSNRMIIFSGNTGPPGTERNDIWILKDANGSGSPAWEQLFPTGSLPPARTHSQGFYDPLTNRLVIFAGRAAGLAFNDVWILEHANGLGGIPNWTQVLPGGIPPARRGGHIMFYDAQRNRSIIFGGGDEQADPIFNDTWILTEANGLGGTPQWIQLAPTGGPPIARFWPSAGYSKSTNRLVVTMGNQHASPFYTADTWVLNDESNMPPACVAPPAGMVGWWPGDGDANDIADGNHGTLQNGTAFVPGMVGQAISFDGIDDYVSISNSPNLQLPDTAFTITLWFKTTSLARAEGQVLLSKGVSDANEEYNIQLSVDGSIYWDYGDEQAYVVTNPGIIAPTQWFHLAVLYDTSSNPRGRVYVNGVEQAISLVGIHQSHITNSGSSLYIGTQNAGMPYYGGRVSFEGLVDEVAIFTHALTVSEIQAIYNAGSAGKCKNRPPTAVCHEVTASAGPGCTANASIDNGSFDPDGDSITVTQNPPGPYPLGQTLVTLTVTDNRGASSRCAAMVIVTDNMPPTIACPANITATAAVGQFSTVVSFSNPVVTDNCTGTSVVCLPPSGSAFPIGRTTVTCIATDASANQANCTFKVAVSGTLLALADSFLRDGADSTNEGANERLRLQSSGHNRALARFDLSAISTDGLQSAMLVLNIAENSDNWGTSGRLVDAHRLLADWTEGNGRNDVMVGGGPGFRGTGEGVTWKCAKDAAISDQRDDCSTPWNGGTFAAAIAASKLHTNNQTGDVSWNVTADLHAGADYGWLIRKQVEGQNGQVRYYSREGAGLTGDINLAPRLVLVYVP